MKKALYSLTVSVFICIIVTAIALTNPKSSKAAESCSSSQVNAFKDIFSKNYADSEEEYYSNDYDSDDSTVYYTGDITPAEAKDYFNNDSCKKINKSSNQYKTMKSHMQCKNVKIPIVTKQTEKVPYTVCEKIPYYVTCTNGKCPDSNNRDLGALSDHTDYCDVSNFSDSDNNDDEYDYSVDYDQNNGITEFDENYDNNNIAYDDNYYDYAFDLAGNFYDDAYYHKPIKTTKIKKYKIIVKTKYKYVTNSVTTYKNKQICYAVINKDYDYNNNGRNNYNVKLPTRGKKFDSLPGYVSDAVNKNRAMSYAIGDELSNNNRSIHFYLDNAAYKKCGMLFSEHEDGSLTYWGMEKIGKHACAKGSCTFIPSSEKDAKGGYHVFTVAGNGLLHYINTNVNW